MTTTAKDIETALLMQADDRQRLHLMRFFKTGKGEYGEGDEFLGLRVPQTRLVVKEAKGSVSDPEIEKLLCSRWHEVRLAGFLLLVEEMKHLLPKKSDYLRSKSTGTMIPCQTVNSKADRRKAIAELYLNHARQANNWDLVDMSCPKILGYYLLYSGRSDYSILYKLAKSHNLWEQRIAMVTNWMLIRKGIFGPALDIADILLCHPHDLIHKAVGWMLREIGKRDKSVLIEYLEIRFQRMSRTTLRYAIEKFPEPERLFWINHR